jgi:hypothetical protein
MTLLGIPENKIDIYQKFYNLLNIFVAFLDVFFTFKFLIADII